MSLTLPIEDISRLRVFAHLNNSGLPVLSLSLRSTAAGTESGMKPPPSGIYINFERTNEGGCWSLAMKAIFEEKTDNQGSLQDPLADSMQRPATNISSIISSTSLDFSTFTAEFPDPLSFFAASFGSQIDQDPTMLSNVPSGPGANQALPMLPFPLIPEPEQPSFSSPATTTHIQQSETQPYSSSSSSPSNGPEYADSPPSSGPERIHTHPKKPKRKLPCTMGCSEQFSRQHDRFRHEVSKHGLETKWVCEKCRGFFSNEKSLNIHKCSSGTRWRIAVT